jgi:hypothetical protein
MSQAETGAAHVIQFVAFRMLRHVLVARMHSGQIVGRTACLG